MTRRRSTPEAQGTYTALSPTASVITVEAALEHSENESHPA